MFTIAGFLAGSTTLAIVTWDNGRLSFGDTSEIAKEYVLHEFRMRDGDPVGPVGGPYTERHHVKSALSSLMILDTLFGKNATLVGDIPVAPETPYDAVV